ncbi:MAG: hypothetical protein ACRC8A_12795 [Microcoleaceae cyanobacterium]
MSRQPQSTPLKPLKPYEDRLLAALSFFRFQRQPSVQAHHCLSLYLRQSQSRIMDEISFYAEPLGLSPSQFLELIYQDPDAAEAQIRAHFNFPQPLEFGIEDPLDEAELLGEAKDSI